MNQELNKIYVLRVDKEDNINLYKFIQSKFTYSLKAIKRSIEHGQCRINGKLIFYPSYVLKLNDKVEFFPNSSLINPAKLNIKNSVIYEDEYLIAINKPPFFTSDTQNKNYPSAISEIKKYLYDKNEKYVNLLHRLDEDTSGVLLTSKNIKTEKDVLEQFKNHKIKKVYLAFTDGVPIKKEGKITSYIGLVKKNGKEHYGNVEKQKGRFAETDYKIIERFKSHAIIELYPLTGRTHQIRIHLASIKCPVSGDTIYGKNENINFPSPLRQLLHSSSLTLIHPVTKKEMTIKAAIPNDMNDYIARFLKN